MEKVYSEHRAYYAARVISDSEEWISTAPPEAVCWSVAAIDETVQPFEPAFETSDDKRERLGDEAMEVLIGNLKPTPKPRAPRKPKPKPVLVITPEGDDQ